MPGTPIRNISKDQLIDERKFILGDVYWVKDELVQIPDEDRLGNIRNFHPFFECFIFITSKDNLC